MRDVFEIRGQDAAGRLGTLSVPRAGLAVETPALLPVVNPHLQTVAPRRLADEFGAEILITNSYILHGSDDLREEVIERGLHDLLEFPGAIMTDSGSFQLAEYGEIDVTSEEILAFQREIGSDIGTPVDIPTAPDVDRERAEEELRTTQERLERAECFDAGEMLVSAPIQGSTQLDLRTEAARHAYGTDLDVFPVGAVVPLMNAYRFDDVVEVVAAAKRGLGADAPVHLFGAGHPMLFALAVACGCDLFDSAAYALYARDGRYLTVRGTRHLDELDEFPCACPVCTEHTPRSLRSESNRERERLLAEHNLHVSFAEFRRIKAAIRSGKLLELVETRARAHPAMLDGYRALLEHAEWLEASDPASKDAFFYVSGESALRPEVGRHHDRLARLSVPDRLLVVSEGVPANTEGADEVWSLRPPFGPVPPALSETYPCNAELPSRLDVYAYEAAADGVAALAMAHPETEIRVVHDGWPASSLSRLPECVERREEESTDSSATAVEESQ